MSVASGEPTTEPSDAEPGLGASGAAVFAAAKEGIQHVVELAAAEARLAAVSGVSMLVMVILAAALCIVTWILLAGVAGYLLVAAGLSWPVAGIALAAAHAVGVYLLWRGILRLSRNLTLPVLRRTVLHTVD